MEIFVSIYVVISRVIAQIPLNKRNNNGCVNQGNVYEAAEAPAMILIAFSLMFLL